MRSKFYVCFFEVKTSYGALRFLSMGETLRDIKKEVGMKN